MLASHNKYCVFLKHSQSSEIAAHRRPWQAFPSALGFHAKKLDDFILVKPLFPNNNFFGDVEPADFDTIWMYCAIPFQQISLDALGPCFRQGFVVFLVGDDV